MSFFSCNCGDTFETKAGLSSHERYCEESGKMVDDQYECECGKTFIDLNSFSKHKKNCPIVQNYFQNPTRCKECNQILKYNRRDKKFCSRSCSASFNNKKRGSRSDKTKEKISESVSKTLKRKYNNRCNIRFRTCLECKNTFVVSAKKDGFDYHIKTCSDYCHSVLRSKIGRKSVETQGINRRSKNEIYFAELCESEFDDVLTNKRIFEGWDADVILKDHKIAVLWNGIWHYEKITEQHSVEQVQKRDKKKKKAIKSQGYEPYVIKDKRGHEPEFVEKKFNQFLSDFN